MKDKVAVVTGAAMGNGQAIAERLAAEGAHVVCGDLNDAEVESTVAAISAAGGRAEAVHCDVTKPAEVEALLVVAEELGGPHAVVAQAGCTAHGTTEQTTPEEWDHVMAVDVKGTFLTVRASIPRMRRLGGGSIVTMSGTLAYWAEPGIIGHCTAKAAIRGFTRGVAAEYGDIGVRCNCIVPGYVDTPMVQKLYAKNPPEVRAKVERWHALNRIATPQEIANLALFLCSDESSFCSGQAYFVDGGLTCGINSNEEPLGRRVDQPSQREFEDRPQ